MVEGWLEFYSKYLKQRTIMIWTLVLSFFATQIENEEDDQSDRIGTYGTAESGWRDRMVVETAKPFKK